MKTTYILKLPDNKDLNKLIKYHINFIKIKYQGDTCFLYVDDNNYQKLLKYFKIYNISLIKINGLLKYKILLKKYYLFLISTIIGLLFLYLLTHIIFDIKIMTNKKDLIRIIENEFDDNKLLKYHLIKSYDEKEKIKEKILEEYKDKIEWLEIDRVGTRYYVRVLERIINKVEDNQKYQNVVARRNAIILEIKASNGQIIKKVNDYVNKGDVIISGNIIKKDDIKNRVKAEGTIYGETWYTVKVELPKTYENYIYTGKSYNRLTLNIFNKKIYLFGKKNYQYDEEVDKKILDNRILPFNLSKTKIYEMKKNTSVYTYVEALSRALDIARSKLMDNLLDDSRIIEQKKLKLYEENSKIIVEVFFRVYENITNYEEIVIEGE